MRTYDELYIGGRWVAPANAGANTDAGTIEVIDPSTEQVCGRIPAGTPADVDRAVAAARGAFDTWGTSDPQLRRKAVAALAEALADRADEMAEVIATEMGTPVAMARIFQSGLAPAYVAAQLDLFDTFPFEERIGHSLVLREPVGVVGAITPWNFPLFQVVAKLAPALIAGCTVVLKPSEVAPLSAYLLTEIVDGLGLPPGVFNLVPGTGPVVGEAIAGHPDVDLVSLTGSVRAGTRVAELAAPTVKRVTLELGGKSANIILDDADLDACIAPGVVNGAFLNSGQTCSAQTRMLVPRSLYDDVVERARVAAEGATMGPATSAVQLGPLVSAAQRDRVRGYIQGAIDEGARLVTGGVEPPEGLEVGYFVRPTVLADVTGDMTVAQEEVFGPVLSIIAYDDEDDAVRIANGTPYGLGGGVQSRDPERALRVARRLRTGQVDVNGGGFNVMAPFGGYKRSGNGREHGRFGLEELLEVKSVQLPK